MFIMGVLEQFGWTEHTAHDFADHIAEGRVPGRVGRVDRGECDLFTADGLLRVLSDSQRSQDSVAPATGDWAAAYDDPELGPVIHTILPRRTAIVRRDPSERIEEQVLVANADVVGVVHGLDHDINAARLERFLVLAWDSGAEPLIVLTKTDLVPERADLDRMIAQAEAVADVRVIATSATALDGLDAFKDAIGDGTLVLIGPSGAGKSTLVNALVGSEVQDTGEVREGDSKGRHTTVTRDLIPIPTGGVLIDTPGVRAVGVWAADIALDRVFADISELAESCRFNDCTHRTEPGCAVTTAVDAGEVSPDRLDRYLLLWEEITEQAEQAEQRNWTSNRKRSR